MSDSFNILILSCGTRNRIVEYFKKALAGKGQVIATDCSQLAPALYDADRHYIVPRTDHPDYLDYILSICQSNRVKAVMSLIDLELGLLAKHRQDFLNLGATPIISSPAAVEMCYDKYQMFCFLVENGFRTASSYIDLNAFYADREAGKIDFPVFIKPVKGSASIDISKAESRLELEVLFNRCEGLMIQEYMYGTEYGLDMYVDMLSAQPAAIFAKEKIAMRAGETDKSVSVKDERLFSLVARLAEQVGLQGVVDIDVFEVNGQYYISEVNPRFGGGYPHAYECGVDIPAMILNNLKGFANPPQIGQYEAGIYMLKYNDLKTGIIKAGQFQVAD